MWETMHRLQMADPATFYALPAEVQALHLAHVRNDLGGLYLSDTSDDEPAPTPTRSPPRQRQAVDGAALMRSLADHKSEPPSIASIDAARALLAAPGVPEPLRDAALANLAAAGVSP
jgi:hypothetical protein